MGQAARAAAPILSSQQRPRHHPYKNPATQTLFHRMAEAQEEGWEAARQTLLLRTHLQSLQRLFLPRPMKMESSRRLQVLLPHPHLSKVQTALHRNPTTQTLFHRMAEAQEEWWAAARQTLLLRAHLQNLQIQLPIAWQVQLAAGVRVQRTRVRQHQTRPALMLVRQVRHAAGRNPEKRR
jgi:hypothetical protein